MSVLDKKLLIEDLTARLDNYVPANTTAKFVTDVGEILLKYDVKFISKNDGSDIGINENDQLIKMYLESRSMSGLSDSTIGEYRYRIEKMLKAICLPIRKITVYHIRQFMLSEKERGISANTLKTYRNTYVSFFAWLHREEIIDRDPTVSLDQIRAKAVVKTAFSATEIQRIKESCDNDKQLAMVHFLLSTGCRVAEVCSVDRNDIDWQNLKLQVTGKGNKTRTVYIDDVTSMILKRYLETRKDDHPALFLNSMHERYNNRGIQKMLKVLGERAGVESVHPHRFRHTLATNLISRGMPIQEVSAVLGHSKLETTMTYVHLDQRSTEFSYRKYASV